MSFSRFPWISTFVLALTAGLLVAACIGIHIWSAPSTGYNGAWSIDTRDGRLIASRHHMASSYISRPAPAGWSNAGGFSYEKRNFSGGGGPLSGMVMAEHLAVPIYPMVVLASLAFCWQCYRWIHRQPPAGHCEKCGYDLRGTTGCCPECGAPRNQQQQLTGNAGK